MVATSRRRVASALKPGPAAVVALMLACAAPAWASLDCAAIENAGHGKDTHAVIGYVDSAAMGVDAELRSHIQRHLRDTVLLNYLTSLGIGPTSVKKLIFVLCESDKRPTTLTKSEDIDALKDLRVTIALWRAQESGKRVLAHTVIPHLHRSKTTSLSSELTIVFADTSTAAEPQAMWQQALQADSAGLSAMLGLALGLHYIEARELPAAKLVLCKSRKDAKRAFGSLLRPPALRAELDSVFAELLLEAEKAIAATRAAAPADLQSRINVACAP